MSMEEWWTQEVQLPTKEERRTFAAINMYTVWNLWKERNRRIFEGKRGGSGVCLPVHEGGDGSARPGVWNASEL